MRIPWKVGKYVYGALPFIKSSRYVCILQIHITLALSPGYLLVETWRAASRQIHSIGNMLFDAQANHLIECDRMRMRFAFDLSRPWCSNIQVRYSFLLIVFVRRALASNLKLHSTVSAPPPSSPSSFFFFFEHAYLFIFIEFSLDSFPPVLSVCRLSVWLRRIMRWQRCWCTQPRVFQFLNVLRNRQSIFNTVAMLVYTLCNAILCGMFVRSYITW